MSHYLQRQSVVFAPGFRIAQSGAVDDPVAIATNPTQTTAAQAEAGQQEVDTGQRVQQALDKAGTVSQSLVEVASSSPGWTAVTAASIFLSAIHGTRRNDSVVWGVIWGAAAAVAPVIVPAIALGQGFGQPAGGDGKKKKK